MFVLLAILISAAILGLMYRISKEREASYQNKYQQIADLRQLVYFCRRHRAESHNTLVYGTTSNPQLDLVEQAMIGLCNRLISNASLDNKPVYRILEKRLLKVLDNWQSRSINQNQMMHGKTIRHCLFLIDELALTWLAEKPDESIALDYNTSWQRIIDTMETLTQFRIAIVDMQSENGYQRLLNQAETLHRRLNQLSIISPLTTSSPAAASVINQLEQLSDSSLPTPSAEELYRLSSAASLLIFSSYDNMLERVAETFYQPLPKLQLAA